MLARAAERLPAAAAMPGGTRWEPKWDGWRAATVVHPGGARLFSRQQKDLTARFPELAGSTAEQVPVGCVLDGEVVRWSGERLDFDALQRRLTASARTIGRLAEEEPATYVAFDLLAVAGHDLRGQGYAVRRQLLEELAKGWRPPLSLSPSTDDRSVAERWMRELAPAGVEGVVAKGALQPYLGGRRDRVKVRHRDTVDLVAGAVTGSLPSSWELILGRFDDGVLRVIGRTTPVNAVQARVLGEQLRSPASVHPWPEVIRSTSYDRFNKKRDTVLTLIEPIVVEVSADTSLVAGALRHPARFVRTRPGAGSGEHHGQRRCRRLRIASSALRLSCATPTVRSCGRSCCSTGGRPRNSTCRPGTAGSIASNSTSAAGGNSPTDGSDGCRDSGNPTNRCVYWPGAAAVY
jgi:ATP-dependent DNA ligase